MRLVPGDKNGTIKSIPFLQPLKHRSKKAKMEHSHSLDDVLVFLLAAVVVVTVFKRLRVSPIIGYLIAGILIGPHAFGFISDIQGTKFLGEFGVVFLLFSIGLKLTFERLHVLRRYVFGLGSAQVIVSTGLIASVSYYLGQSIEASILIGSALALSSTAVCLQILSERQELAAQFGRVTFATLLFQDLAVVLLLVLLTSFADEHGSIMETIGFAALKAGIVLAIIIAAGRVILRPVYKIISSLGNPELFVAMSLLVVLATSMATHQAGLSMELGAFLAGMLLSETEYRHQVEADIQPFHGLLLGLFFMTVGMAIDLSILAEHVYIIPLIILAMILGKLVIVLGICKLFKLPLASSLRAGLLLATGGEFVFVVLAPAINAGLMPEDVGYLLYVVVAISMGLTPFLDSFGKTLADKYFQVDVTVSAKSKISEIGDLRNHVIISGYGRVGKLVGRMLAERLIPFVAIDKDMDKVNEGQSKGLPVYYGDAKRVQVMRALGLSQAKVIVICVHEATLAVKIALMVRRNFPDVKVLVRMPDDTYLDKLTKAGIEVIMPENLEPSLLLASTVFREMGVSEGERTQIIDGFRNTLRRQPIEKQSETNENRAAEMVTQDVKSK